MKTLFAVSIFRMFCAILNFGTISTRVESMNATINLHRDCSKESPETPHDLVPPNTLFSFLENYLNNAISSSNISKVCEESLITYLHGIKEWRQWTVQMADASAKLPFGLLTGNRIEFGSFDECLAVRAESFRGQFCLLQLLSKSHSIRAWWAHFQVPEENKQALEIWMGTCWPSLCIQEDIYEITGKALSPWATTISITDCQTDEEKPWALSNFIPIFLILCLIGICILGTILDQTDKLFSIERKPDFYKGGVGKCLKCFSLSANTEALFRKEDEELRCLNGFRVLLSMWVIAAHLFMYPEKYRQIKYTAFFSILKWTGWRTAFIENALIGIENFILMSGLLMVEQLKKALHRNDGGGVNIVEFIIKRYFRTMPIFFLVLILNFVLPMLDSGPIWNSSWDFELQKCYDSWWRNVLCIQNFNAVDKVCWVHTWFLAVLLQVQIVGLFILMLTYRNPKLGILFGSVLCVVCIGRDYYLLLERNYPMLAYANMKDFETLKDYATIIYFLPGNHVPSFLIGMLLSWILQTHRHVKLPKKMQALGWIFSISVAVFIFYAIYLPVSNPHMIALYYASRNIFWSLSFSWVIYTCATGNAGNLNKFFSSNKFIVGSRISFGIYMIHPLLIVFRTASLRERIPMGVIGHIFELTGILFFASILSIISFVCVEQPLMNIYSVFVKNGGQRKGMKQKSEKQKEL